MRHGGARAPDRFRTWRTGSTSGSICPAQALPDDGDRKRRLPELLNKRNANSSVLDEHLTWLIHTGVSDHTGFQSWVVETPPQDVHKVEYLVAATRGADGPIVCAPLL